VPDVFTSLTFHATGGGGLKECFLALVGWLWGEQIWHNQSGHVAGAQVPARSEEPKAEPGSSAPRVEPAAPRGGAGGLLGAEPGRSRGGAGAEPGRLRERSRGSLGKRLCVQVKLINSPGGAAAPQSSEFRVYTSLQTANRLS
jgi:hypothetical protein